MIFYNGNKTKDEIINPKREKEQDEKIQQLMDDMVAVNNLIAALQVEVATLDTETANKLNVLSTSLTNKITATETELKALIEAEKEALQAYIQSDKGYIETLNAPTLTSSSINTNTLKASSSTLTDVEITDTLKANIEEVQQETVMYLTAVNASISNLNMSNLDVDDITSRYAELDNITSLVSDITRLNATLITVSDSGIWREPTANPVNDELLKMFIPSYNGEVNIVAENGQYNITLLDNTLLTFEQEDLHIYRVEFDELGTYIYFNNAFPYKEIHIGASTYSNSETEIVDREPYKQNINALNGTVSKTVITFGDAATLNLIVADALPDDPIKKTIYLIRNDRAFYYDDEKEKWISFSYKIDFLSGHTTTGEINENLIYPAVQYNADFSEQAFNGTFYEITSFMKSSSIPTGAKLIYIEDDDVKFASTYAPYSGTKHGTTEQVEANLAWFNNIDWIGDTVKLSQFTYSTPCITFTDDLGNSAYIATQTVQSYVDYKQNAINNELDIRSIANTQNITNIINSKGKANGIATLDETGRLPASQLPVSAITVAGYLDAANAHILPEATEYDPGSEIIMISDGYYVASTAFTLTAGKTLTDIEVAQANKLISYGYVFTLTSGSATLGTVSSFANDSVVLTDGTTISLPYASDISATSVPDTVNVSVKTGDVVIQIDGHWIHMENKNTVSSVNGKTGAVIIGVDDIDGLATTLAGMATKTYVDNYALKTICGNTVKGSGNITLADLGITIV